MGLAAMGKAFQDDFVRVEYIENTSKAYINTLYKLNHNSKIEAQFSVSEFSDVNSQYLFGARTSNTINKFYIMFPNNSQRMQWHYRAADVQSNIDIQLDEKWTISNNQGTLTYSNGTDTYTLSNVSASFSTAYNCVIFCMNGRGSIPTVNCFKGRIYYFKIYQGNELVRDYIPVYKKSTKQYGLWDRVERRFYTSPNGTKFIGGHQIIYDAEIEYLRGTNNQYIDTGIIPNDSTGVYVKGYRDSGSDNFMLGCRNGGDNTRWAIGKSNSGWYYGWSTFKNSSIGGNPADIYLNYKNDRLFKVTASDGTNTLNLPSLSFTPAYNIRLFGSAGVNSTYTKWNGRIYAVQITQGTEIIMDLIPVRVGNVGYMYDKISNKLFGNNGSGSFILGQDTVVYDKI